MTQIWNDTLAAASRVARTVGRSRVALGVVSAAIAASVAVAVEATVSSSPGHATPVAAPKAAPRPAPQFFVAFYEQSLGPGYGPFILVTSAHSDAIADWEGSGDAVIGIHGPLGADIGSAGVAVSHGCMRLQINDLMRLAGLPAGTPRLARSTRDS